MTTFEENRMSIHTKTNILFVLVFVLLALVAWQEIRTRLYVSSITSDTSTSTPVYGADVAKEPFNQADEIRKQLLTSATSSFGEVITISSKEIVVKTKLIDVSKLAALDFSKNPLLPMLEKELTAGITAATTGDVTNLKAGDVVMLVTKESVYSDDALTAVSISRAGP